MAVGWLVIGAAMIGVGCTNVLAEQGGARSEAGAIGKHVARDEPIDLQGATGEMKTWLESFNPPAPGEFEYSVRAAPEDGGPRWLKVTFESAMKTPFPENNTVPAELYLPARQAGRNPAAIVLDISQGNAVVARIVARSLAERGVEALYFPMPFNNVRKPKANAHFKMLDADLSNLCPPLRQTVMDARRARAILAARDEVDASRIGITGVSLGGIMTCLIAGVDGHFHRVAAVLAGGDLAAIAFHARETRGLRAIFARHDIDEKALRKLMAPVDPLTYAGRIDPKSCLMINASQDQVIPRRCTLDLSRAMGGARILWLPTGHYNAVLYLPNIEQGVADFLKGRDVRAIGIESDAVKSDAATKPAATAPALLGH